MPSVNGDDCILCRLCADENHRGRIWILVCTPQRFCRATVTTGRSGCRNTFGGGQQRAEVEVLRIFRPFIDLAYLPVIQKPDDLVEA